MGRSVPRRGRNGEEDETSDRTREQEGQECRQEGVQRYGQGKFAWLCSQVEGKLIRSYTEPRPLRSTPRSSLHHVPIDSQPRSFPRR